MNITPTVSIIVPVFNVEKSITRCVESILKQTFQDFELILIDDGSSDRSGEICDNYTLTDKRIIVIHQENRGVSIARNIGLDIAKGKYISFIDSDDFLYPEFLDSMLSMIESEDADLVMCDYSVIKDNKLREIVKCDFGASPTLEKDEALVHIVQTKTAGYFPLWNKLYKSEIINKYNLRIPLNVSLGEDSIFNLAYIKYISSIAHIDYPLYNYIISESGLYRKYRKDFLNDCFICRSFMMNELRQYEYADIGFVNINKKTYRDIERFIILTYLYETNPREIIYKCYSNPDVADCMRRLLKAHKRQDNSFFDSQSVRIAKLISHGYVWLAVWYTDYIHNSKNAMKKIRKLL